MGTLFTFRVLRTSVIGISGKLATSVVFNQPFQIIFQLFVLWFFLIFLLMRFQKTLDEAAVKPVLVAHSHSWELQLNTFIIRAQNIR